METITGDARAMDLEAFDGPYQTILADPPWLYAEQRKTRLDRKSTRGIGACHHYDQLTTDEICAMPVAQLAAPHCHLYLWATCPLLPDALRVMGAWGFRWATVAWAWVKMNRGAWKEAQASVWQRTLLETRDEQVAAFLNGLSVFNPGFYTGSNVELVLLGTRGQPFKHAPGRKASQIVYAPREVDGYGKIVHSAKPPEVQRCIEWMYPNATPRLELFARRPRAGWTAWGNEV